MLDHDIDLSGFDARFANDGTVDDCGQFRHRSLVRLLLTQSMRHTSLTVCAIYEV